MSPRQSRRERASVPTSRQATASNNITSATRARLPRWALPAALTFIALLVVVIWWPTMSVSFLSWDDNRHITLNPFFTTLPWTGLWTAPWFGMYVPVISSLWRILFEVGSGSAIPFRLLNVGGHAINAILVALLLQRQMRVSASSTPDNAWAHVGAIIGAMVFAVHPLQVETVAWISAGRDITATTCALGALLLVTRSRDETALPGAARELLALTLFATGLLCKPSIATVPVAMLGWALWWHPQTWRRDTARAMVWSTAALLSAVVTNALQSDLTPQSVPWPHRALAALDALGFYVAKLIWPSELALDYGRTPDAVAHGDVAWAPYGYATIGALLAVALVASLWHWRRRATVAWSLVMAIVLVAPVLGLLPFSFQRISTVADHYAYVPLIAVAAAIAAGIAQLGRASRRAVRESALAVSALVVLGASVAGRARVAVWGSDAALFTDAVAHNPASRSALINLSMLACNDGDVGTGVTLSARALNLDRTDPNSLSIRAYCLFRAGRIDEVLALVPNLRDPAVLYHLDRDNLAASSLLNTFAGAFFQRGDVIGGWPLLCQAAAIRPEDSLLRDNIADMQRQLARDGHAPSCPGRQPWTIVMQAVDMPRVGP